MSQEQNTNQTKKANTFIEPILIVIITSLIVASTQINEIIIVVWASYLLATIIEAVKKSTIATIYRLAWLGFTAEMVHRTFMQFIS